MSRETTARELLELRDRAKAELTDLDQTRRQLKRLISFAEDYARSGSFIASRKETRRPRDPFTFALREHPGIRGSMLAMVLRQPQNSVLAELERREASGSVRRDGLGWRLTSGE